MKKKAIFFLPAILFTAFFIWGAIYMSINEPLVPIIFTGLLWGSGIFLSIGKALGALLGALAVILMSTQPADSMNVTPILVGIFLFYMICGIVVFIHSKKQEIL